MASDFEVLREKLTEEARNMTVLQNHIFVETHSITVEYSLLGSLRDMLNAAVMLSHTIDRVRFDEENQS